MDRLKRRSFFSGGNTEKNNETPKPNQNIYYEGQNVNDCPAKEEQEEVKTKENKRKRFFASYNMFF